MAFFRWFAGLGLVGMFMACGGTVEQGDPVPIQGGAGGAAGKGGAGGSLQGGSAGAPKGGAAGAGQGGAPPAGGSSGGPGGGPGGGPPDAGPDGPIPCIQTYESFAFKASLYDGNQLGCGAGPTQGVFELKGVITSSGSNSFTLDSCPPNADCMPMISSFAFDAPGLYAWFPGGAFVTVRAQVTQPWACTQQIEITNLPSWGGLDNPYGKQKLIYLSASDGVAEALPGSDIAVFKQPLGCVNGPGCGGDPTDMYVLLFGTIWQSSMGIPVGMGTTAYWDFKGANGVQYLQVRNLRSYSSGMCDDYWNWAWWVAPGPIYD